MRPDRIPVPFLRPLDLRFVAHEREVRRVLADLRAALAGHIAEEDAGSLELALAEALNNIVEHAYAGRAPGVVSVSVMRNAAGDALLCRIEDDGLPMPGLTLPEGRMQPIAARIEDLPEGGWGWALIRALTEGITYARQAGRNRLDFRLPIRPAP